MAIKRDTGFKAGVKAAVQEVFHRDAQNLPALPGAYVLVLDLAEDVVLQLPRKPEAVLAPGRYLYFGSARGLGGIKARVARHMRREKPVRWHVDRLTTAGEVGGGDECALVARFPDLPVPMPGFGSSDCRTCASHLLALPDHLACLLPRKGLAAGAINPLLVSRFS